jgi:hypothetical protein
VKKSVLLDSLEVCFMFFYLFVAQNGGTHAVPPCVGEAGWAWAAWSLSALLGAFFFNFLVQFIAPLLYSSEAFIIS